MEHIQNVRGRIHRDSNGSLLAEVERKAQLAMESGTEPMLSRVGGLIRRKRVSDAQQEIPPNS